MNMPARVFGFGTTSVEAGEEKTCPATGESKMALHNTTELSQVDIALL